MNGSAYSKTVVLLSLLGLGMITPAQSRELSEEDEELVRKMIASSYSNEVQYLPREEFRACMEQTRREMLETARAMEPFVRYFETNTPVICEQVLRLIPEAKILASIHKLDAAKRCLEHELLYELKRFNTDNERQHCFPLAGEPARDAGRLSNVVHVVALPKRRFGFTASRGKGERVK